MSGNDEQIEEQAIRWIIRLRNASSEDWAEFTHWLEANPAHSDVYDRLSVMDDELGGLPRRKPAELTGFGDRRPAAPRGRAFAGWAVAAAALLGIGYVTLPPSDTTYVVATAAGQHRTVQLADGSRIDLNGSTKVTLDREQPRFASLEQGEALFTVVHRPSDPFQVRAGDNLIYDVGTVFDVVNTETELEVAVAEGAVIFNPKKEAVNLTAGMSMEKRGAAISVKRGDAQAAGSWRHGQLIYSDASVSEIAADLSRNLGVPVRAGRNVENHRFSGVLSLDGDPQAVLARASALLGVRAKRLNEGWIFSSD